MNKKLSLTILIPSSVLLSLNASPEWSEGSTSTPARNAGMIIDISAQTDTEHNELLHANREEIDNNDESLPATPAGSPSEVVSLNAPLRQYKVVEISTSPGSDDLRQALFIRNIHDLDESTTPAGWNITIHPIGKAPNAPLRPKAVRRIDIEQGKRLSKSSVRRILTGNLSHSQRLRNESLKKLSRGSVSS